MNRRGNAGTATGEHILDVALDLFSGRDYNGTSIKDITIRANITNGALHNYFRDKKELFIGASVLRLHRARQPIIISVTRKSYS